MDNRHSLVWFRRDLRFTNNTALSSALTQSDQVSCVFVFDEDMLKSLPPHDRRVSFIWESLEDMNRQLAQKKAGPVHIFFGKPDQVIPRILSNSTIDALYVNHDYEPEAIDRDKKIHSICKDSGINFHSSKDQVIFEKSEIIKNDGTPYKVFTAYKNKWLDELQNLPPDYFRPSAVTWEKIKPLSHSLEAVTTLSQIGFKQVKNIIPGGESVGKNHWGTFFKTQIKDYFENRNLPGIDKTSHLSPYLRFGNLSIRDVVGKLKDDDSKGAQSFLSELIWREFFMMILFHFPHVVSQPFNSAYDGMHWQNRRDWFGAWCDGKTGFPIVDAGMRQLNETGFMHNRLRMITASFLVKHLHIDWRWGEKYFAQRLLDFELSSNNGNWQWAAGTGVDAAPYFRIFNPLTQSRKFDAQGSYIKRWLPELDEYDDKIIHEPFAYRQKTVLNNYTEPIIDLAIERKICLEMYNYLSDRKK
ncbi:deoxyribodipyrimidine photo-lyase [bacterium]|nr:MAG: deoxyribodipyrimidine photo-lyase [bacterium]